MTDVDSEGMRRELIRDGGLEHGRRLISGERKKQKDEMKDHELVGGGSEDWNEKKDQRKLGRKYRKQIARKRRLVR